MTAIGIDLGTTNSAVAYYDPARRAATVLANSESENLTPSVVGLRRREGAEDSIMVGRTALNWADRQPRDTILSVKRLMGRAFTDQAVVRARSRMNYEITPGPDQDPRAHVVLGDRAHAPAEISSMILSRLKRDASRTLGDNVTHAVITVPAYFEAAQRAATREAGEQAGLTVKKIMDEPTAAAVAYGLEAREDGRHRVLVYDLGGGTFDISILHTAMDRDGRPQFQVLDYAGDNFLGGDDFDLLIVDRIIEWVKERAGVDPSTDKKFLLHAKTHAERAKRELGREDVAEIGIPGAFQADGGLLVDVELTITRDEFDRMIAPLVDRTMDLVQQALARQTMVPQDITDVLLVGGATLTPKVYQTVENFFGRAKVRRNINPMECVALGAGILAGTQRGIECLSCQKVNDETAAACADCGASLATAPTVGDTGIYEVTGMALGIAAVRGSQRDVFVPIIPRGTPYPLPEPMHRSFEALDGRHIRVPVYEGDNPVASKNREQGVIEYELPQEIDINTRVDVSFNYDANRIVTVTISVPGTALSKTTELRTDIPPTPAAPAPQSAEDDAANERQELANAVEYTQRFLQQYEPYIEPAQAIKIRRDLDQAKQAFAYSDVAECRRMSNVLESDVYTSDVATQMFVAERATNGAPPAITRDIHQAISALQSSYHTADRDSIREQTRVLKLLVAAALRDRDVEEIGDAEILKETLRDPSKS